MMPEYAPYASFTTLAQGLAQLAAGNGSSIYQMQLDSAPFECGSSNSTSTYLNTLEVLVAVSCGDGVEITDSVTELQEYWTELSSISSFADAMIWVRATCAYGVSLFVLMISDIVQRMESSSRRPLLGTCLWEHEFPAALHR